jgi:hypothetical protein
MGNMDYVRRLQEDASVIWTNHVAFKKKNTNKEAYKLGGGIRITKMERYNSAVKVMLLYLEEWPAFAKREKSALDGGAKLTTLLASLLDYCTRTVVSK